MCPWGWTAFSRWTINAFERAQSTLPHSVIRQDAPPIERWRLPGVRLANESSEQWQWGGLQFTGTGEWGP